MISEKQIKINEKGGCSVIVSVKPERARKTQKIRQSVCSVARFAHKLYYCFNENYLHFPRRRYGSYEKLAFPCPQF